MAKSSSSYENVYSLSFGSHSFNQNFFKRIKNSESGYARGPERALLSALLFDGIQSYMNYIDAQSKQQREKYKEAYNWVHSQVSDYVFSFENVCEALGINPNYLRFGLINASNSQSFEWKKARRTF